MTSLRSPLQDFEGQKKAEKIFQIIIVLSAIIGFGVGYHAERLSYSIYTLGVGFLLGSLVTIPPWPMYRKHPLKWQPVKPKSDESD